ncbi:MAG TPA: DUF1629 domain-containing protein [Phycisphaerales bacterium]|nr:DUF1629 domain-containing protein [Phycisphaerales bacterium]
MVWPEMSFAQTWAFAQGKPLPPTQPRSVVVSDAPTCFEDMAWGDGCGTVVSTRLRTLLERIAPGHAQFIPCTVKYGKRRPKVISEGEHWMVNWLHMVDCFDTVASRHEGKVDQFGDINYTSCFDPVYDLRRIPPEIRILRVKGARMTVLVDAGIREAIEAAGITGPQFMSIRVTQ